MNEEGAALATLISRILELGWVVICSYRKGYIHPQWKRLFHREGWLEKDFFPQQLQAILCGGSYLRPEVGGQIREKGVSLYNLYGSSEVLGAIAFQRRIEQAAFRAGDGALNTVALVNPFLPLFLEIIRRYNRKGGNRYNN